MNANQTSTDRLTAGRPSQYRAKHAIKDLVAINNLLLKSRAHHAAPAAAHIRAAIETLYGGRDAMQYELRCAPTAAAADFPAT